MPQNAEVNVLKNYQKEQNEPKTITKQINLINPLLYRIILISNFLIYTTILLAWVIWSLGFKNEINEFITKNLNEVLKQKGYNLIFDYYLLTITILIL